MTLDEYEIFVCSFIIAYPFILALIIWFKEGFNKRFV